MRLPGMDALQLVDTKDPKRFTCEGDESLQCCKYEVNNQVVIATGKAAYFQGDFALENPVLCTP